MDLKEAQEKLIFTVRYDIDDADYIVLREPTMAEAREFSTDGAENVQALEKIFPSCIIEHSFTDGGVKATNKDVAKVLMNSGTLFSDIIEAWMNAITLKKTKSKKSEMLQK